MSVSECSLKHLKRHQYAHKLLELKLHGVVAYKAKVKQQDLKCITLGNTIKMHTTISFFEITSLLSISNFAMSLAFLLSIRLCFSL